MLLSQSETKPQADSSKAGAEGIASFNNKDHDQTQTAQACNKACDAGAYVSYRCKGWWCKGHHHQRTPHHPWGPAPPQHLPSSSAAPHAALAPCDLPCFAHRWASKSGTQGLRKATRARGHCVRGLQQHIGELGIVIMLMCNYQA